MPPCQDDIISLALVSLPDRDCSAALFVGLIMGDRHVCGGQCDWVSSARPFGAMQKNFASESGCGTDDDRNLPQPQLVLV